MVQSEIDDYADRSAAFLKMLEEEDMSQPGDPEKGVRVMIDLVRMEGCALDRKPPFRLPLGTDCYESIRDKCEATLALLKEWEGVIKGTDYEL